MTGALPADADRRGRDTLMVLAFLTVVGVTSARLLARLDVPGAPSADGWGLQDFRDAIYYPVVAWWGGGNPYNVEYYTRHFPVGQVFPLYAPSMLLVHLPLGLLPYRVAQAAWVVLNLVLLLVLARVTLRSCELPTRFGAVLGLGAVMLATRAGHQNFMVGQPTLEFVLGCYLAVAYARDRPVVAGLGLAIASMKPTFGGALGLLLLARGNTRAVVVGAVMAGIVNLAVSAGLAGAAGGLGPFLTSIRGNLEVFDRLHGVEPMTSPSRIDAPALVARLVGYVPGFYLNAMVGVGILAIAAAGVRRWRASSRDGDPITAGLIFMALLLCFYHGAYDLLLLALPVTALVIGQPAALWSPRPMLRWVLLALLMLVEFNYVSSERAIEALHLDGAVRMVVISFNASALLLVFGTYAAIALRGDRGQGVAREAHRRAAARG